MYCEGVSEFVWTRSGSTAWRLDPEFAEQYPQCLRCRLDGQWRCIFTQEEGRRIKAMTVIDKPLTCFDVAPQLLDQVVSNGDDTSSPLAVLDHQDAPVE